MVGLKKLNVLVFTLMCVASRAHADEPTDPLAKIVEQARLHFQEGEKLYNVGRYAEALAEFQAGYALAPRPEFLLNLGQVQRKLGDRAAAIDMFEKFLLGTTPDDPRRAAVEDVLAELRAELKSQPAAPEPLPPLPPPPPHVDAPMERHWYGDWVGGTLTGVGAVGIGVGLGLFVSANNQIGDAGQNLDSYFAAKDAMSTRTVGLTVFGVGTALVIGGVIRYIRYSR